MKRTFNEETALIKKLQAECPALDMTVHKYHENNTSYHIAVQAINDAYWRRRMLSAKPGECAPG